MKDKTFLINFRCSEKARIELHRIAREKGHVGISAYIRDLINRDSRINMIQE